MNNAAPSHERIYHPSLSQRLYVALDFEADECKQGRGHISRRVLEFADELAGLGVGVKLNSILRACGYDLIDELHVRNLKVFADLKLPSEIDHTLTADAALLREAEPEFVTISCHNNVTGMLGVVRNLGNRTKALGVTIPSGANKEEHIVLYNSTTEDAILRLAIQANKGGLQGLVQPGRMISAVRQRFPRRFEIAAVGVRPSWSPVRNDDQQDTITPGEALRARADILIVGRPITQAKRPTDAIRRILDEMASAECTA